MQIEQSKSKRSGLNRWFRTRRISEVRVTENPYIGTDLEIPWVRGYQDGINEPTTSHIPPADLATEEQTAYQEGEATGRLDVSPTEVSASPAVDQASGQPQSTVTVTTTFWKHFSDCMGASGLPVPSSLFATFTSATATIGAIQKAVAEYGTEVTIAELVGARVLSDYLLVAGSLSASFYAGACVGCLGAAGVEWATD
jgi:hypothetical protein